MLTVYSVVKGFVGPFAHIQRNAIRSGQKVLPGCEIILFGDDEPGSQQEAMELGVPVLPMERTEHGAPLLPYVIGKANEIAKYDVRCLVNADVILDSGFALAMGIAKRKFDEFLLIAQRNQTQIDHGLDFDGDWFGEVEKAAKPFGNRSAIDFFCYRGEWLTDIPPFGIGRTAWDNWIVQLAVTGHTPVIEATEMTHAWHQMHDKPRYPEQRKINLSLMGDNWNPANGVLDSARWVIRAGGRLVERKQYAVDPSGVKVLS